MKDLTCDKTLSQQSNSTEDMTVSKRRDVKYKSAIRLLRRFYKNSFKAQNRDLFNKRFYKCTAEYIYERVQDMLAELIPQQDLTEDLVHYTIGIIGIKKAPKLPCCMFVKNQIAAFQS